MESNVSYRALIALTVTGVMAGDSRRQRQPRRNRKAGQVLDLYRLRKSRHRRWRSAATGKWLGLAGIQYTRMRASTRWTPMPVKSLCSPSQPRMSPSTANLTEGQKAMFARYPKTFSIPVYPGHRDFRYPDFACASAKANAQNAVISADGMGADNAVKGAIPLPSPRPAWSWPSTTCLLRSFTEHTLRDNAYVMRMAPPSSAAPTTAA
jgi:hypothetical protein